MKKVLFIFWIFVAIPALGQWPLYLKFELAENTRSSNILPDAPQSYLDQSFVALAIDSLISTMRAAGYLDAALDTLIQSGNTTTAIIVPGNPYQWRLASNSISREALAETGMHRYFIDTPLPFGNLRKIQEKLLEWYENNGYPFASLSIENIRIDSNTIFARMYMEPNAPIQFEALEITGDVMLAEGFLRRHTGIVSGMPYSEEKAKTASRRLNELAFADVVGSPQILFSPATARISIPLRQTPANRFDGLAGFGSRPDAPGKLQFTGMLQLDLVNLFRRAEQFSVHWQGPGHGTQRLSISANVPYIFSTPLTPRFQFSLHKQDSTFIQVGQTLSLAWLNLSWARFSVFVSQNNTSLLPAGRNYQNLTLPTLVDSRTLLYGKTAAVHSEAFFANLMDGSFAEISLSAGNKNLINDPSIPNSSATPLQPRQNRVALGFRGETRIPVSQLARLVLQLEARSISGHQLFINEMHRIGGTHSLKGIDEQAITASAYAIASAEFRYFTGPNSYFSVLANGAWFEKNLYKKYERGLPWGVAAGITLQTRPGLVSLFFALGDGPGSQFAFRNTKVHVGLTSLF